MFTSNIITRVTRYWGFTWSSLLITMRAGLTSSGRLILTSSRWHTRMSLGGGRGWARRTMPPPLTCSRRWGISRTCTWRWWGTPGDCGGHVRCLSWHHPTRLGGRGRQSPLFSHANGNRICKGGGHGQEGLNKRAGMLWREEWGIDQDHIRRWRGIARDCDMPVRCRLWLGRWPSSSFSRTFYLF